MKKIFLDIVLHVGDTRNVPFWLHIVKHLRNSVLHLTTTRFLIFFVEEPDVQEALTRYLKTTGVVPDVCEGVINRGADSMSWIHYLGKHTAGADYCLKLHTKDLSTWTYMLLQPLMDLAVVLERLEEDSTISLAGRDVYVQPLFFGLPPAFREVLGLELRDKLGIHEDAYTDEVYLEEVNRLQLRNWDASLYRDRRPDIAALRFNDARCQEHFSRSRSAELIHARHDVAAHQARRRVFIAGTIFIARGDRLRELAAKAPLDAFRELLTSEPKYYKNFDHNGHVWRWTNALEYMLQAALVTKGVTRVAPLPGLLNLAPWIPRPLVGTLPTRTASKEEERRRVLFVSHELTWTGAPLYLIRVMRVFAHKGWSVALVADRGGDAHQDFAEICGEAMWILTHKDEYGDIYSKEKAVAVLIEHWRPSVVYLNTVMSAFALRPAAAAFPRPALIAHIHESTWDLIHASHIGGVVDWDDWKYCDRIICVNECLQHCFERYAPSVTVYNDMEEDGPAGAPKQLGSRQRTVQASTPYVAGTGTLAGRRKGFDIYCAVARRFPQLSFRWAGGGETDVEVPTNVTVERLPPDGMRSFFQRATCLLCTSRSESWGLANFEALRAGTSVMLASKSFPFAKLHEFGFIVVPGVPKAETFQEALTKYLTDPVVPVRGICLESALAGNKQIIEEECRAEAARANCANAERSPSLRLAPRELRGIGCTFERYCLSPDLIRARIIGADLGLKHYLHNGFMEGRSLFRSYCPMKPVVLFCLHASTLNGATLMGLDIASELQKLFSVVVLVWGQEGAALGAYTWEFQPLVVPDRAYEHGLLQYHERVQIAKHLLATLEPDLVYVNCSVVSHVAHAALMLDVPAIVHHHDSPQGYKCQLAGYQVQGARFHRELVPEKHAIKFFSVSQVTTGCMRDALGIPDALILEGLVRCRHLTGPLGSRSTAPPPADLKRTGPGGGGRPLIGMVGERTYRKGYDVFCRLARSEPLLDFVWIGDPSPEWPEGRNDPGPPAPNLQLLSARDNVSDYIRHFSLFLCTSRCESVGLVVLESLVLGIPTVVTRGCVGEEDLFRRHGAAVVAGPEEGLQLRGKLRPPTSAQIAALTQIFAVESVVDDIISDGIHGLIPSPLRSAVSPRPADVLPSCQEALSTFARRRCLLDFDAKIYASKYGDLKLALMSDNDLEKHWKGVGHQKRNCLEDDWALFRTVHEDEIRDLEHEKELCEDRSAWEATYAPFNAERYLRTHPDLQLAFGEDEEAGKKHFLAFGLREGRVGF